MAVNANANYSVEDPKGYIITAEVDRNSWSSRKFYRRIAVVYIIENKLGRHIAWDEYDSQSGQLVSRSLCTEKEIIITNERTKTAFRWDINGSPTLFPHYFFTRSKSFLSGFKMLEMRSDPMYLPTMEAKVSKEDALKRYDPSTMQAVDTLSFQDAEELGKHLLFLKNILVDDIWRALLIKNGLTTVQVLASLKTQLGERAVKDIDDSIRQSYRELNDQIGKLLMEGDLQQWNEKSFVAAISRGEETAFYLLKKKLYEIFYQRIKGEESEYVWKNPREAALEQFISRFDENNLKRVMLKPLEDTEYNKSVSEINYHQAVDSPIIDFLSIRWTQGNTSFRKKFTLSSLDSTEALREINEKVDSKRLLHDLKTVEGHTDRFPHDLIEEYAEGFDYQAYITEFTSQLSDNSVEAELTAGGNFPDNTVMRIKVLRSGYDFVQGGDLSEDAFIRYSSVHVATQKLTISSGAGSVSFKLKPSKYEILLEFSLDDQNDPVVREKFKGAYLKELDRINIVVPNGDVYIDKIQREFSYMSEGMAGLKEIVSSLLSSDDKQHHADQINKFKEAGMELMENLKNNDYILNASRDYSTIVISFIAEKLFSIKEVKLKDNTIVFTPGKNNVNNEEITISLDTFKQQLDFLISKFQACMVRELFLQYIETFRNSLSLGLDRGILRDFRNFLKDSVDKVVKFGVYETHLKGYFEITYKGMTVNFLDKIEELYSIDLLSKNSQKEMIQALKILENRLMYGG